MYVSSYRNTVFALGYFLIDTLQQMSLVHMNQVIYRIQSEDIFFNLGPYPCKCKGNILIAKVLTNAPVSYICMNIHTKKIKTFAG